MILWITGNSKAGKSTLAKKLLTKKSIWLDGDAMRGIWPGLGFSKRDRIENNLRIASLAKLVESQEKDVIVSSICPYMELREQVKKICGCIFVFIQGGQNNSEKYPYEQPKREILLRSR